MSEPGKRRLADACGRALGSVDTDPSGRQRLSDYNGRTLGFYDPTSDRTTDYRGVFIGKGNLLATLLE